MSDEDWSGEVEVQEKPKLDAKAVDRLLWHNATLRRCMASVHAIKCGINGIDEGCFETAQEAWDELTEDEQSALYIAPSKGGIFTTHERSVIKSGFKQEN